ncbi:MAG: alpha/beta hydrolase [Candidatus Neomarinimicrobiota bacterium]
MKNLISIILLLVFACSNSKPVDSSKLAEREGLVYYNKSDTPFSGKGIKYWPTGEVQIKSTFEAGILIQSSFLGTDGSLLESTEVIDDTTISIEWFANGEKRWESNTVLGYNIYVKRWNEDGTKRKELFDWEKEILDSNDLWDIPLKYIINKPSNNSKKQDVLYFMHAYTESLPYYKNHVINQFGDNYVTVILQAPYEVSLASGDFSWFDFDVFDNDTTFNEYHLNESLEKILYCIDKIIIKEKISPARIFIGGFSQGGTMACKLALEHPDVVDGFILHNTKLPNIYQIRTDKSEYETLKGLVINGKNDQILNPINSKQIANTFLTLGVKIQSKELEIGHEFPKLSRDVINDWITINN